MRRPLVAGNWKMNGTRASAEALARAIAAGAPAGVETLVCPPSPYLALVGAALGGATTALGAQDCSEHEAGAYTGEVAASMLADNGCSHVIIGHSERRQFFGDTDARVAAKLAAAYAHGLTAILCVGESLDERRAGHTEAVVVRQLESVLGVAAIAAVLETLVIAYEPVWAIGTGESATPQQAEAVHAAIRARIAAHDGAAATRIRILYGGSVKADNATELFAMPNIDGGLIGGASLAADTFISICQAAADAARR